MAKTNNVPTGSRLLRLRRQTRLDDALPIGADEALWQTDVEGFLTRYDVLAHAEGEGGGAHTDVADGVAAGAGGEVVAEDFTVAGVGEGVGVVGGGDCCCWQGRWWWW